MKATITLSVDTDALGNMDAAHLAALWFAAQANPLPAADRDACELVQAIGTEIIARWLDQAPKLMHERQPDHHYWHTLQRYGSWTGPDHAWRPDPERMAEQAALAAMHGGAA